MNKIRKRKYTHRMSKLHFAISVMLYYISAHAKGLCSALGFGLVALGLTLLRIDFYAAVSLCAVGGSFIGLSFALGRSDR